MENCLRSRQFIVTEWVEFKSLASIKHLYVTKHYTSQDDLHCAHRTIIKQTSNP